MKTPGYLEMTRRVRKTQPYGVHPVWKYNTKMESRRLADLAGIRAPELYDSNMSIHNLTPPDHPFVLKPNNGSGGKSVLLLAPRGGDMYEEIHLKEIMSWDEAKERALVPRRKRLNGDNVSPPWLLEELLVDRDGIPLCNWNLWVFGNEVGVVSQTVQKVPGGMYKRRWYDPDWNDIGDIRPRPGVMDYVPTLSPPSHPAELLRAAQDVSRHVPAAFIRVDLYDTANGPVFGEITPWPGGRTPFVPEWESRLGKLWYDASKRMV